MTARGLLLLILTLGSAAGALECGPRPATILPVQVQAGGLTVGDALIGEDARGLLMLAEDLHLFNPPERCPAGTWQPIPFPAELDRASLRLTLTLPSGTPPTREVRRTTPLTDATVQVDLQAAAPAGAAQVNVTWPVTTGLVLGGTFTVTGNATGVTAQGRAQATATRYLAGGAELSGGVTVSSAATTPPVELTVTRRAPRATPPPLVITAAAPGEIEVWFSGTLIHAGRYPAGRTVIPTDHWPPVAGTLLIHLRSADVTEVLRLTADLRADRPVSTDRDATVTVRAAPTGWEGDVQITQVLADRVRLTLSGTVGPQTGGAVHTDWVAGDGSLWTAGLNLNAQQAHLRLSRQAASTLTGTLTYQGGALTEWTLDGRAPLGPSGTGTLGVGAVGGAATIRAGLNLREWPFSGAVTAAHVTVRPTGVQGSVTLTWAVTPALRVDAQASATDPSVRASVSAQSGPWTVTGAAATDRTVHLSARGPAQVDLVLGERPHARLSAALTTSGQWVPPGAPATLIVMLGLPGLPVTVGSETSLTDQAGRVAFQVPVGADVAVRVDDRALPLSWLADRTEWVVRLAGSGLQGLDLRGALRREPLRQLPLPPGSRVTFAGRPLTLLGAGYVYAPGMREGDQLEVTDPDGFRLHCPWTEAEVLTCTP